MQKAGFVLSYSNFSPFLLSHDFTKHTGLRVVRFLWDNSSNYPPDSLKITLQIHLLYNILKFFISLESGWITIAPQKLLLWGLTTSPGSQNQWVCALLTPFLRSMWNAACSYCIIIFIIFYYIIYLPPFPWSEARYHFFFSLLIKNVQQNSWYILELQKHFPNECTMRFNKWILVLLSTSSCSLGIGGIIFPMTLKFSGNIWLILANG